jgi:hypothetical protein
MFIEDLTEDEIAASEAEEAELAARIATLRKRRGAGRHYPSWRYHRTENARIVKSPDEDRKLGDDWADVPFDGNEPVAQQVGPDSRPLALSSEEEKLHAELHAASVAQIDQAIAELDDVEELERLRARERRNPKNTGGRKGVLKAIDARIAELTART